MAGEVGNGEIGTVPAGAATQGNGGQVIGSTAQDGKTVQRLRFGIGAIGLLLPPALPIGNWIFVQFGNHTTIMPNSMSSSYYTSTRNLFVGSLCALGVFLIGYRGKAREDLWTTIIGVFALGVALCPTAPHSPTKAETAIGYVHLSFAAILLSGLALFCITSFHRETNAGRDTTNYTYLVSGASILVFLLIAIIAGVTEWGNGWTLTPLYICEALSVWAFGVAWLAAALELGNPLSSAMERRTPRASSTGPGVSSVAGQPL